MHIIIKKALIYVPDILNRQEQEQQLVELRNLAKNRGFLVEKELIEKDGLKKLFNYTRKRQYDVLLISDLNSIGQNLLSLRKKLQILSNNKIDLIAIKNNLETEKNRELIYSVIEAIASFEHRTRSRLVKAGQANALHKGKKIGRPRLPLGVYEKAMGLRNNGYSYRRIGVELNIDESTVRKWVLASKNDNEE